MVLVSDHNLPAGYDTSSTPGGRQKPQQYSSPVNLLKAYSIEWASDGTGAKTSS